MYRALYRKWRPRDFDDVCGQEHITDILKYEVAENKTSHAYLFCGSRGTGKTSCAKILAKAVNCEDPQNGNPCNACAACRSIDSGIATDVIEMDAASNTGVDHVRDIKDEIVFTPAELRYRVYIIDEVHMMSGSAFNALLKTLEEPPQHVVFILATTELQKLPSTIVSRCQHFDFRRLSSSVIVERLSKIAAAEGIDLTADGARILARMALGGMRDAISLLELCAGMNKTVDATLVTEILGAGNRAVVERLITAVLQKDYTTMYGIVAEEVMSSRDLAVLLRDVLEFYRDIFVVKTTKNAAEYLDLSDVELASLLSLAERFTVSTLLYHSRLLEGAQASMLRADAPRRSIFELTLARMCEPKLSDTKESMLARLEALENEISRLKFGITSVPPVTDEQIAPPQNAPVDQTAGKDAPSAPAASEAPIPAKGQAPKEESGARNAATYTRLSTWTEVVEKVAQIRPGVRGFLDNAKAYVSGDRSSYLIRVGSPFFVKMLSRADTESAIKLAIAQEEGCDMAGVDFRIVSEGELPKNTVFEELSDALSEDH